MIDLTGRPPAWPATARRLWAETLQRAAWTADLGPSLPHRGLPELIEVVAESIGLDPDETVITAGVRATVRGLLAGAGTARVERPSFRGVRRTAERLGRSVATATWTEILSEPADPQRVTLLTSPARNPDGRSLVAEERRRLEARAGTESFVQNLTYGWFADSYEAVRGAALVGSFHKVAGMGLRLGFASRSGVADRLDVEQAAAPPSAVVQHAWAGFLRRGGLDCLRPVFIDGPIEARRTLVDRCGWDAPIDGPTVLVAIDGGDEQAVVAACRARGVLVGGGSSFDDQGPSVRLCCTDVTTEQAAEAGGTLVSVERDLGVSLRPVRR